MTDVIYLLLLAGLFGLAFALIPALGRLYEHETEDRK